MPVISATWETEAGELLEPGKPRSCHSLGDRARLYLKKIKKNMT